MPEGNSGIQELLSIKQQIQMNVFNQQNNINVTRCGVKKNFPMLMLNFAAGIPLGDSASRKGG